ncbi:hypothetical protein PsorP6_010642 [Peronosclerospora sorghi]|uniref:Uncharacterized protein n=1 Tax=Peronosclerospora sorghi TaxID=230839 RepID=A0ACC0VVN5_9STRA|nr:hypothetical protein PsorP6_010642 [Peronosclerospora sorghi]
MFQVLQGLKEKLQGSKEKLQGLLCEHFPHSSEYLGPELLEMKGFPGSMREEALQGSIRKEALQGSPEMIQGSRVPGLLESLGFQRCVCTNRQYFQLGISNQMKSDSWKEIGE